MPENTYTFPSTRHPAAGGGGRSYLLLLPVIKYLMRGMSARERVLGNKDLLGEILLCLGDKYSFACIFVSHFFEACTQQQFGPLEPPSIMNYCHRVELAEWILDNWPCMLSNDKLISYAAQGGHVEVIQRARLRGCLWSAHTCNEAAFHKQLRALQWLRSQIPPCPWNIGTPVAAAKGGSLPVMQFLIESSPPCPIDVGCVLVAAYYGREDMVRWLIERVPLGERIDSFLYFIAWKCRLSLLAEVVSLKPSYQLSYRVLIGAVKSDIDCTNKVLWILSVTPRCVLNEKVCATAASLRKVNILEILRNRTPPCPWSESTCTSAAEIGDIHLLEWLRSHHPPCPWSTRTCTAAVRSNSIDVIRWLREGHPSGPCPWDSNCCAVAARNGNIEILEYLRSGDNLCPWDKSVSKAALEQSGTTFTALIWLRNQTPPCPWDTKTAVWAMQRLSLR